jgi:hypothetical protein
MNSQDDQENELQRLQRELQARERAIRLRELEAEINQPLRIVHQPVQQPPREGKLKRWSRQFVTIVKLTAIGVAVMLGIAAGVSFFALIVFGVVAWVAYKLFLTNSRTR